MKNLLRASHLSLVLLTAIAFASGQNTSQQEPAEESNPNSAKETSADANRVILKVGGVEITKSEFESTIDAIEPEPDPEKHEGLEKDRRRLADDYASVLMLSQQAVANHLDSTPDVRHQLAVTRMQVLSDAQFAQLMAQNKATPDEVLKYYESHLADFDQVQVQRLFIWKVGAGSKNTKGLSPEDAKARAAAIMAPGPGEHSLKLAEMFNQNEQGVFDTVPVKFERGQLPANLEKVAFTMKPGRWAEGEDTADRMILLYLVDRDRQPISEATSQIEKLVQGEKMQVKLDQMKRKTGVWMDPEYFGSGSAAVKDAGDQHLLANPPKSD